MHTFAEVSPVLGLVGKGVNGQIGALCNYSAAVGRFVDRVA